MPPLPEGAAEYKRTPTFDATSTPAGLRARHTTKSGVWGQLVVEQGTVLYVVEDEEDASFVLRPGIVGIIAPEVPHHVVPDEEARFHVRFLRVP